MINEGYSDGRGDTMTDRVNRPAHYTSGKIECIDAIEVATEGLSGFEGYCTGNAIKYIWRWKKKSANDEIRTEDLRKASWYINRLIEKRTQ